jgi:hypothetical protein
MRAPIIQTPEYESESSDDPDVWVTVPGRPKCHQERLEALLTYADDSDIASLTNLISCAVRTLRDVLERELFWERYLKYFSRGRASTIRAYGIGSPSNSHISRFQLALLVLLKEKTGAKTTHCFDPVLNCEDSALLTTFGISSAPRDTAVDTVSNEKCCTFFFMPHCDRTLYEWVLVNRFCWSNPDSVLISNRFSDYSVRFPQWSSIVAQTDEELLHIFHDDHRRSIRSGRKTKCKKAEASSEIPYQAFNDLAVITAKTNGDWESIFEHFANTSQP